MKKKYIIILIFISVSVFSANLDDFKIQFETVKGGVEYLTKDYIDDGSLKSDYKLSKRFNDGYVTFLLGDYPIATMIFYDIVSRKEFKNEPVYLESLFYLAESFRHLKNYLGAREYYQQVLEYHNKKFNQKALRYFLELSRKVGDFRGTDKYMAELKNSKEVVDDSIYYEKGKSMFYQKRYDKAAMDFLSIKKTSTFRVRAVYYAAVCYTAKAKNIENEFSKVKTEYIKKERKSLFLDSKLLDQKELHDKRKEQYVSDKANYKEVRRKFIQYNKWYYTLKRVNKKLRERKAEFNEKHKIAKEALAKSKLEYETELEKYNKLKESNSNLQNNLKDLRDNRNSLKEPYKERLKLYKKAIELFNEVRDAKVDTKDDQLVVDQAILSIGRISYTLGNTNNAINAYQDINRNSKFYDVSLYESAWTYIKDEKPKKALFAIDLLIDVLPDSVVVPDALLLRANLYNEMNEFEKAIDAYAYIGDRYLLISEELQKIISDNDNLEAYFSNILSADINSFSASKFLPKEALKYVRSEKLVKKAQVVVKDINETQGYLKDSMVILDKLLKMLSDEKSINALFPKTEEIREKLLGYTNKLLEIEYNLNNYLAKSHKNNKSKERKILRLRILKLWESFSKIPASKSEYQTRKRNLNVAYLKIKKKAYKLNMYVDNLEKEIKAMELLFSENIRKFHYSLDKQNLFYENISLKKKKISFLKKRLKQLTERVDRWKESINSVDKANIADQKIREKLYEGLKKEREYYKGSSKYQRANILIKMLGTYKNKIEKFSDGLDDIVLKKAKLIKNDILKEKSALEEYKIAIDDKVLISKKLSTIIALTSFRSVNNKFYNLILNADLGELEVIWKGKDKLSKEIQSYYSQERNRLRILDSEFKEILGEDR